MVTTRSEHARDKELQSNNANRETMLRNIPLSVLEAHITKRKKQNERLMECDEDNTTVIKEEPIEDNDGRSQATHSIPTTASTPTPSPSVFTTSPDYIVNNDQRRRTKIVIIINNSNNRN
eukprot:scaffold19380_cov81-Skeletonema_menzelii.AAC.1